MKKIIAGILGIAALITLGSSVVITHQNDYTLIRQFGRVSRIIDTPGLQFKIPFIQTTATLPKEILLSDLTPSEVITADKKTMICDSYVLWQIKDPLTFTQTLNSSISNAEYRINTAVYNATKNVISSMNQDAVISSRDGALSELILQNIGDNMDEYGVALLSVENKQLDLPNDNKEAVYERMISERDNIAATYTAEGNSEAKVIRNETDKEAAIQLSEAEKQAEILKAEGEAEYMRILSEAYSDEAKTDFYAFVRSLDALRVSMSGENKTLILSPESPIAQIFYGYH